MNNLTVDNLFGRAYFRCSNLNLYDGYFDCIKLIKPLLEDSDFKSSTPGLYINVNGEFNSVRLSYFTSDGKQTIKTIKDFVKKNTDIKLFKEEPPEIAKVSDSYGGEELRFRKFLHAYTQVGLDLLDYDTLYARRLVAEYRLGYSLQRLSSKALFEPAFRKHSNFFNQLDNSLKDQLLEDLDYWHSKGDWAHMMVNMLLPGDFNGIRLDGVTLPLNNDQKNNLLITFGFTIPPNWTS